MPLRAGETPNAAAETAPHPVREPALIAAAAAEPEAELPNHDAANAVYARFSKAFRTADRALLETTYDPEIVYLDVDFQ